MLTEQPGQVGHIGAKFRNGLVPFVVSHPFSIMLGV
jgi:hypothetical protein